MTPAERIAALPNRKTWSIVEQIEFWDAMTALWDDMSMKPFLSAEDRREREDEAWRASLMAQHCRRQLQAAA